jgi:hypothetical protein
MKKLFVIVVLTVLGSFLAAQNVNMFNDAYTILPNMSGFASTVILDNAGYIIYGTTADSTKYSGTQVFIAQLDSIGNLKWSKSYGKRKYNYNGIIPINGGAATYLPWGGYIGTGYVSDTNGTYKLMLWRFDNNGDTLWTRTYLDSANKEGWYLKVTRNHKFVIAALWANYNSHLPYTATIMKTDSLGNKLWERNYTAASGRFRYINGIDTCNDGGYIISMWDNDTLTCGNEIAIIKTDSLGNQQWIKYIGNGYCNADAGAIISLREGGYIVCGSQDTRYPAGLSNPNPILYLSKLDNGGNIVWHKTFGFAGGQEGDVILRKPKELINGNIVICGNGGDSNSQGIAGVILKTDSAGNQEWLRLYAKLSPKLDGLLDILPTNDGGYISCGYIYGSIPGIWVVKVDSNGCDTIGCRDTVTVIKELQVESGELKVFPNPANTKLTVQYPQSEEQLHFTLYDVLGNKVEDTELPKGEIAAMVDVSNVTVGLYIYSLENSSYIIQRGKVIIQR